MVSGSGALGCHCNPPKVRGLLWGRAHPKPCSQWLLSHVRAPGPGADPITMWAGTGSAQQQVLLLAHADHALALEAEVQHLKHRFEALEEQLEGVLAPEPRPQSQATGESLSCHWPCG